MKLVLCVAIAVLAAISVAQRPSITMNPLNWSALTTNYQLFQVATKKDLLLYLDATNSTNPYIAIRRRNNDGVYPLVANFTEVLSPLLSTNGKWISCTDSTVGKYAYLFNIDENNKLSKPSLITAIGTFLLSDDTVVGFDPVSPKNDGNYTIRTYQYEASNNTWNNIPGTELIVTTQVLTSGDYSTYRVTDTHLVLLEGSKLPYNLSINIYERQTDRSWKLVDTVPLNPSLDVGSVTYNGADTVVHANLEALGEDGKSAGLVSIFTKTSGIWMTQNFSTTSVGYRPTGVLGSSVVFVDSNTLLIAAGFEGISLTDLYKNINVPVTTVGGKVLLLTRNTDTGLWEPLADLVGPRMWGLGVGVNDYDVIIPSLLPVAHLVFEVTFSTTPRCFAEPINVTCIDQQVNDCSQLQLDASSLYTVNNAQCGAVSSSLSGLSLVNNKAVQAQFSFTKSGGFTASCNATVTCPVPPVALAQTPSKVSGANALGVGVIELFLFASMFV